MIFALGGRISGADFDKACAAVMDGSFLQVRSATMDRSVVYEKVAESTKATLREALEDAPAFTSQVRT